MKKRIKNSQSLSKNVKRKSLVIISFAFIFLLSMSIVSASWFSDLFGGSSTGVQTGVRADSTNRVSLRQSGYSSTSFCPRGWAQIFYPLNGKENKCCVPYSGGTDGTTQRGIQTCIGGTIYTQAYSGGPSSAGGPCSTL